MVVVRPESIRFGPAAAAEDIRVEGQVEDAIFLGANVKYSLRLPTGERLAVHGLAEGQRAAPGDRIALGWALAAQRVIEGD